MRKKLLLALSIVLVLFSVSCNKAGKTGLLVPKEAAVVVHINMGSLSAKVDWEEIKQTDWFKEIGQEDKDSLGKQILQDPSKSGIDVKGDHVFFLSKEGSASYYAFVGALKDATAFEKMLSEVNKGKVKITKSGDYSVGYAGPDVSMVWNKGHFVVLGSVPMGGQMDYGKPTILSFDSLVLVGKKILELKGDNLLDSDKKFATLIKEEGDVHFWVNTERVYNSSPLGGMVSMLKVNVLLENNIATATLNFDNGKITVKAKQYFGEEMTSLVKKYSPKDVGSEVINRLPTNQAIAAGVFNYPPEGLRELLKITGVDGMANGFLGKMNYSVDEFIKANKGDIAFALTDFQVKRDTSSYEDYEGKRVVYSNDKSTFKFVAGVSVNDKAAFEKLIGIVASEAGKNVLPDSTITYKLENNWFVTGNDPGHIKNFIAGNNKPAYADKINGHAAGFFVDLNGIMKTYLALPASDTVGNIYKAKERKQLEISAGFWQDIILYSDIKDGVAVTNIEINLADKSTNSLKQVVRYGTQLAALEPKRPKISEYSVEATPDSMVLTPPAVLEK